MGLVVQHMDDCGFPGRCDCIGRTLREMDEQFERDYPQWRRSRNAAAPAGREAARRGIPDSGDHAMAWFVDGEDPGVGVWRCSARLCRNATDSAGDPVSWPCRPALLAWVAALTDACDVSRRALRWYGRHQAPCRRQAGVREVGVPCICGYDVVLAGAGGESA